MKTYICTYIGSLVLALLLTPIVIRLAVGVELFDRTGKRKVHSGKIARIGGIAIFIAAITITIIVYLLPNRIGDNFRMLGGKLAAVLAGAIIVFWMGLIDDIKPVNTIIKLFIQIAAAIFVCSFGVRIEIIEVPDLFRIEFGIFSWPFTVLWIVGITNAINFIDGLDGLAAGISAIACGTIAMMAIYFDQAVLGVMMLAMAGALSGFLFFNFNPAKIFMGDCGSMFLGFTIASATVLCTAKSQTLVGFALPVLALGVPIFDTLFIMLNRFGQKKSVFQPDTEHFHHRLLGFGLSQRHVVIIAYIVTLLATGAGVFLIAARSIKSILVLGSALVLIVLVFHVIGAVSVKQLMRALRRKYR